MTIEDAFAAYVRERLFRVLRRHLAFRVSDFANDNSPPRGAA